MSMGDADDLIIAGAGLYGIQAARTYLEVHPTSKVVILEADSCLGGVWSSKRMYDAFWSQTPVGMAEFSDRPLPDPPREEDYYGFFPAKYVTKYLEDYADNHIYAGRSICDRIRFNCHINAVRKEGDLWVVSAMRKKEDGYGVFEGDEIGSPCDFRAPKLMVATGLASLPVMPEFPNRKAFKGLIVHHKDFGQSSFLASSDVQHVCVIGGAKSAADVVYASAKAGKMVSWIIRKNGSGPSALAPAKGSGPYRNANETLYTRVTSLFNPSPFVPQMWVTKFLHQSRIGRKLVALLWARIDAKNRRLADYGRADGRVNGFDKLKPDTPIFWQNDSTGINQRPDFWDTIAHHVQIHRCDIASLNPSSLVLSSGASLPADVIVCATGWRTSLSIFSPPDASHLGLPVPLPLNSLTSNTASEKWSALDAQADTSILTTFPSLALPPPHHSPRATHTSYHLYRMLVPPSDVPHRSIVFLGHVVVGNNFRAAEVQALWATAYLDNTLKVPSQQVMELQIAASNAWNRRRYLGKGGAGNWLFFDLVPYTDVLLGEVGVPVGQRGWWGWWFGPCVAGDLRGIVGEYKDLYR